MGLAAAGGAGKVEPIVLFAASDRRDEITQLRLADEILETLVGRETQRQRQLRAHASGRPGSVIRKSSGSDSESWFSATGSGKGAPYRLLRV